MTSSKIAVIIPSLNSPIIDRVIANIQQQSQITAVSEIIIVGKDQDNLIPLAENVRLLDTGQPVPPGTARNLGIEATNAELLIFLDSDCLPQPGWLAAHIMAHEAGHPIVGGSVLPLGENYWHLSYNLTLFHETFSTMSAGPHDYFPTLNLSVEQKVVNHVGRLDESLKRGQDIEWTTRMRRAGFELYFSPEAAVYHAHNRTTMTAVWQDCARSGYFMRQIRLQHSGSLKAPAILRYPKLILGLSPAIAAWATWQAIREQPSIFRKNWQTVPAIYLTKIAWCWGASRTKMPL